MKFSEIKLGCGMSLGDLDPDQVLYTVWADQAVDHNYWFIHGSSFVYIGLDRNNLIPYKDVFSTKLAALKHIAAESQKRVYEEMEAVEAERNKGAKL
jgi:hypothetical protein